MFIINSFNAGQITAPELDTAIELANQRYSFIKYAVVILDGHAELLEA